jgi:hypothetical protein
MKESTSVSDCVGLQEEALKSLPYLFIAPAAFFGDHALPCTGIFWNACDATFESIALRAGGHRPSVGSTEVAFARQFGDRTLARRSAF